MEWTKVTDTLLLAVLAAAAYMDNKNKKINLIFLAASAIAVLLLQVLSGQMNYADSALGAALGAALLAWSWLSKETLGYGDGCLIIITGIALGIVTNLTLLFCALAVTAIFSGIMLLCRKKKIKDKIAFAPFILAGYVITLGAGL